MSKKNANSIGTAMMDYLLKGKPISGKNAFELFGCSNVSREIIRQVEKPLGIKLDREECYLKNRFGNHIRFFKYRLSSIRDKHKVITYLRYLNAQKGFKTFIKSNWS